jgi:hypothetical protein
MAAGGCELTMLANSDTILHTDDVVPRRGQ